MWWRSKWVYDLVGGPAVDGRPRAAALSEVFANKVLANVASFRAERTIIEAIHVPGVPLLVAFVAGFKPNHEACGLRVRRYTRGG